MRLLIVALSLVAIACLYYGAQPDHAVAPSEPAVAEATAPAETASEAERARAPTPVAPAVAKVIPEAHERVVTHDPKVRLNVTSLFGRSGAFRAANPGIDYSDVEAARTAVADLKLPIGLKLSYEMDPRCTQASTQDNAPIFVTRAVETTQSIQDVQDMASKDPCILAISLDSARTLAAAAAPASAGAKSATTAPAVDPAQKALADSALSAAAANGEFAKMAVIGTAEDIQGIDPGLLQKRADGNLKSGVGSYTLGTGDDASPTSVNVRVHATTLTPGADGDVSVTALNTSIISQVQAGAKVVNIPMTGVDPADIQSASTYAQSHGAAVVTQVPVPVTHVHGGGGGARMPASVPTPTK